MLNTGGLSAGGLFRIAAMAQADPSELVVKEVEEQALAGTTVMDVEEKADALIKQLEDVNGHGVRTFSILPLISRTSINLVSSLHTIGGFDAQHHSLIPSLDTPSPRTSTVGVPGTEIQVGRERDSS
jgi:hypothetical protein